MAESRKEQAIAVTKKKVARIYDYKRTFASEQGRRVLYDLVSAHYVMGSTFSKDAHEIAFKEGQRQVVLRILTMMKQNPEEIEKLIRESDDHVRKSY